MHFNFFPTSLKHERSTKIHFTNLNVENSPMEFFFYRKISLLHFSPEGPSQEQDKKTINNHSRLLQPLNCTHIKHPQLHDEAIYIQLRGSKNQQNCLVWPCCCCCYCSCLHNKAMYIVFISKKKMSTMKHGIIQNIFTINRRKLLHI